MGAILPSAAVMFTELDDLAADRFCADAVEIAASLLHILIPPDRISTLECAETYRNMPASEGSGTVKYDRWRTPYNVGPMAALDDPDCNLVVMVKPSRSGGTTVAENFAFKMMRFGPMGQISWYLNNDDAVKAYCDQIVKPMFNPDNNPELAAKLGTGRSDNNDTSKRVSGKIIEWLAASDSNFRNREPLFMVCDETDAWAKKFRASPRVQIDGRQKQVGRRRKAIIMSHPDMGYASGVAATFEDTSRGIYVMRCPECESFAAAHATKFWPETPQFKLHYQRNEDAGLDERLAMAERTAAMHCPHCGSELSEEQRHAMVDEALREGWGDHGWMHRGQELDPEHGITGDADDSSARGYWVHGLMLKTATVQELARGYERALEKFQRTRDADQLRQFMSKQLGEIFEGASTASGLTAASLKKRVKESRLLRGVFPDGALFITAAVDVGAKKFDVGFWAWDLEGRSWLLDRLTQRQRKWADGKLRDISTRERLDDWKMLIDEVVNRRFPIEGREGWEMPVAITCIDASDGNVLPKAAEFQNWAIKEGHNWTPTWSKTKLIKGAASAKAEPVPPRATQIEKGEDGKVIAPVNLWMLGVHRLKELSLERLAVTDGGPGQCYFAAGIDASQMDEFFGESLIDGKWIRSGPNESLDCFGYAEAGRIMLKPDRADIKWGSDAVPLWAKPVPAKPEEGGDPEVAAEVKAKTKAEKPASIFDAFHKNNGN